MVAKRLRDQIDRGARQRGDCIDRNRVEQQRDGTCDQAGIADRGIIVCRVGTGSGPVRCECLSQADTFRRATAVGTSAGDHVRRSQAEVARALIPNVLTEMADAGWQRTRRVAPLGMRAVDSALWPAAQLYGSAPVRRARTQAAEVSATLARDTLAAVDRTGAQARATGTELVRQLISGILSHPATETLLDETLADPALERLLTRVLDSPLADSLTTQLLNSNEMQVVLEHVTRSPELRAALSRQTAGMAEDMAVGVRSRTANADATSERIAKDVMRRLRRPATP